MSAIFALRWSSGFSGPGVVSCVIWCSVSAFSLAAIRMTMSRAASRMDKPIGASGAAADLMAQRIR